MMMQIFKGYQNVPNLTIVIIVLIFAGIDTYRELQLALIPRYYPCPLRHVLQCHPYERLLYKEPMQLKKMIWGLHMEGYDLPFYYQQLNVKVEVTTVDILTTNGHNASLYSCFCAKIPSAKSIIGGNGRCLSNCCSSSSRDLGIKIRHT